MTLPGSGRQDHPSEVPDPALEAEALFVYGSLLFPEVLRILIGRVPDRTPATALGWRVAALPDRAYPVLVPGEDTVAGQLITGLSADEWRILDAFEDPVYELHRLTLADGRQGLAYVSSDADGTLPEDWSTESFAAHGLAAYLESCAAWRRRYDTTNRMTGSGRG